MGTDAPRRNPPPPPNSSTSSDSWVGKRWGCLPSESHVPLKARPDPSAARRALHCEGHRRGNGGRTCQPSLCARNTYELYREHVSSHVRYQRSPVIAVLFCFFVFDAPSEEEQFNAVATRSMIRPRKTALLHTSIFGILS